MSPLTDAIETMLPIVKEAFYDEFSAGACPGAGYNHRAQHLAGKTWGWKDNHAFNAWVKAVEAALADAKLPARQMQPGPVVLDAKPAAGVVKEITCRDCGARLAYRPIDVQRYSGTDAAGGPDGREWIVCPQCRHSVTIRTW